MADTEESVDQKLAKHYGNLSPESQWRSEEREEIGLFIGHAIANEVSIPYAKAGKTLIFSVASNLGMMERGIQTEAGDQYQVIASDFAKVERVGGSLPLQADGRALPLRDNSIPCLVDIRGALWHQLINLKFDAEDQSGNLIAEEYRRTLIDEGVLIVEDGKHLAWATGELIDKAFGSDCIPGFYPPEYIGEEPFILRAYKKISPTG
jgi:hypothetical protein